jgi:phosphate-selective porin OprO/OprP
MTSSRVFVLLVAFVLPGVEVFAQTAAEAPAGSTPAAQESGWRDGFVLQSDTGDYRLQIGLLAHADARFAAGDGDDAVSDTFLIRRLRPGLRGRIAQRFEFAVVPDFAGGNLVVQDAYVDTVFTPAFRLRIGKSKTPFGLERLHSASNMLFFERAFPTAIAPNRDVGIQVIGDISGGLVSYGAAVLNGVADGGSGDTDNSDSKDVAGRLLVRPFRAQEAGPLRGLSVGIAGTAGRQAGPQSLPSFRTASVQQPFFSYQGAAADGVRTRYSPQASYYYKAFAAVAEYVRSEVPVAKAGFTTDISHDAWQIAGSWVLTGEAATDASTGIRPRNPFDFGGGHWGAFQAAARYHTLSVSERAIDLDLATPGASRKAEAWTVGLNWFLTQNLKYVINLERTVFDDGAAGARPAETAFAFRTQVNF